MSTEKTVAARVTGPWRAIGGLHEVASLLPLPGWPAIALARSRGRRRRRAQRTMVAVEMGIGGRGRRTNHITPE
jgi:hypothetical protein